MAVNPSYAQLYMAGAAAAWRLGAVEQAHEWVATLRQHPACMGQLDQLLDTLGAAGLPTR
jgi:hypothetical protein